MSEWENLYLLQQVDSELFALEQEEQSLPLRQELEEMETGLTALADELEKLRQELTEVKERQRKQDRKVEDLTAKIATEEDKLYGGKVSNPKELRSIQAEVQSIKRKRDQEETLLLEEMEKAEELESAIGGSEEKERETQAGVQARRGELARELDRIAQARGGAETRRAGLRPGISDASLKVYDDLVSGRSRIAVVKVVEGACQGCHMSLPAQEYDRFLNSDGLFRCSNCRRILVK
jgi:predicted  nucleic acid-binding Zn-ribbon protein